MFQTGYYGWGLKNGGAYPTGFDEYWQESYGGGSGEVADYSFNSEDYTIVENAIKIQQTANANGYDQDLDDYFRIANQELYIKNKFNDKFICIFFIKQ